MPPNGFTILEMIVVMSIIAVSAALTLPRLTLPYRPERPAEVAFLENQRTRAILESQPIMVLLRGRTLVAEPGDGVLIIADTRFIKIAHPQKSAYLDQEMISIFYPDGTTTWSEFSVIQKNEAHETVLFNVHIDPLHGKIVYAAP